MFLGKDGTINIQKVDLRNYMKFVLKDGTVLEKRSVLECITSELILRNKSVEIR